MLECWLSGQAAGGAAADLLVGAANPSGRLAETLPLRLEDTPASLNFPGEAGHVRYGEGIFVGYRGYDKLDRQVSYPFGHGLSYTSFDYADLTTNLTGRPRDGDLVVEVACRVTNTGDRRGKEVVQLYVRDPEASVARQNPVLGELLATITTPTQIVAGRDDDLVPWSNSQYLDDLLPYSELHPLDAGHFAWEQAAEDYGRLVVDWVSGEYRRLAAG